MKPDKARHPDTPKPPAPAPASAETLEQFIAAQLARVENAIRSRREEATVWRDTDEETHEASRVLAERMGGRKLPRQNLAQREELARTQDRICLKLEAEAESYRQVADALRRLQPTEQERAAMQLRAEAAEADWKAVEQERDQLRRLAKEATNGWGCYAKRDIEHWEIARLHGAIDALTEGKAHA